MPTRVGVFRGGNNVQKARQPFCVVLVSNVRRARLPRRGPFACLAYPQTWPGLRARPFFLKRRSYTLPASDSQAKIDRAEWLLTGDGEIWFTYPHERHGTYSGKTRDAGQDRP